MAAFWGRWLSLRKAALKLRNFLRGQKRSQADFRNSHTVHPTHKGVSGFLVTQDTDPELLHWAIAAMVEETPPRGAGLAF